MTNVTTQSEDELTKAELLIENERGYQRGYKKGLGIGREEGVSLGREVTLCLMVIVIAVILTVIEVMR